MRRSPAFLVSSNSLASFLLLAAMASKGDRVGGTSPSKCWIRGEVRPFLDRALAERVLASGNSMKLGRLMAANWDCWMNRQLWQ